MLERIEPCLRTVSPSFRKCAAAFDVPRARPAQRRAFRPLVSLESKRSPSRPAAVFLDQRAKPGYVPFHVTPRVRGRSGGALGSIRTLMLACSTGGASQENRRPPPLTKETAVCASFPAFRRGRGATERARCIRSVAIRSFNTGSSRSRPGESGSVLCRI